MPSTPYHIMFLVRLLQGEVGQVRGAAPSTGHWAESAGLDCWPCACLSFPIPRTGGLPIASREMQAAACGTQTCTLPPSMAMSPLSRCRVCKSHQVLLYPFTHPGGHQQPEPHSSPPPSQGGGLQSATHPGVLTPALWHWVQVENLPQEGVPRQAQHPQANPMAPGILMVPPGAGTGELGGKGGGKWGVGGCTCFFQGNLGGFSQPALLGVLIPFVVELQGDLRIQANAKVVIHDTFLREVAESSRQGRWVGRQLHTGNCWAGTLGHEV